MKTFGKRLLRWFGIGLGFTCVFLAIIYVHVNWSMWEAPATFLFLTLAVVLGVVVLRIDDSAIQNIAGCATVACVGLSVGFATFNGWKNAVIVIYGLATLAYILAMIWYLRRSASQLRPAVSAPIHAQRGAPSEQAILADAAEPYVLFPAKWKIARILLILLAITALFGAATFWRFVTSHDTNAILFGILLACLAALCGLTCFLLILRLISRQPALVVTHLGLLEGASALYAGVGPIWWEEVANVRIYTPPKMFFRPTYRYLVITPVNAQAILRRQPFARRLLLRLYSPLLFVWLEPRIPAWMFQPTLKAPLEQLERYAAPARSAGE